MDLQWMSFDYFVSKYMIDATYNRKRALKKIVREFLETYPKPEDWLNTPIDKTVIFSANGYSDLSYIACWALENHLFTNKEYSLIILNYFLDERYKWSHIAVWLVKKLNYITENELQEIRSHKHGLVKHICIHCLFLSKSFKDFTDDDVYQIPSLLNKFYNAKAIKNIRMKLGYSTILPKRARQHPNWEALVNIDNIGLVFNDFRNYLALCNASKKYITTMGGLLVRLVAFLKKERLTDFSMFDSSYFTKFTEYLLEFMSIGSASVYIGKLKKFFQWGVGMTPYFPTELDFPNTYWHYLMLKAKKARKETDGLAFSEPELAQLIVTTVYKYKPQNEAEELCRYFWLILSSCPARFSYILNLGAFDSLQPLPNEPNTLAIYSELTDKSGNKYGQFPILDSLGVDAVKSLQVRAKCLNLKPITNSENNNTYVHLFQLTQYPWIINHNLIRTFFQNIVTPELTKVYPNINDIRASAHGFRHHLLTHVALVTGDISAVQTASGHKNEKMVREYLRSKVSRAALLFRVIKKYDNKEITGKFYLRLIELLSVEDSPIDEMLKALTTEIKLSEFICKYGKKLEMGYCFNRDGCSNWFKCWNCINFMMTREEISDGIKLLSHQIINLREMQKNSGDFNFDNSIIQKQLKTISLIVKRLTELNLNENEITKMVDNYIHHKVIEREVPRNA